MAIVYCEFDYDEKDGITQVTHIVLENHDTFRFVTKTQGLILKSEGCFPPLELHEGDQAPVRFIAPNGVNDPRTPDPLTTNGVRKLVVYYHGPTARLACGQLDVKNTFQAWPRSQGQVAPDTSGTS